MVLMAVACLYIALGGALCSSTFDCGGVRRTCYELYTLVNIKFGISDKLTAHFPRVEHECLPGCMPGCVKRFKLHCNQTIVSVKPFLGLIFSN